MEENKLIPTKDTGGVKTPFYNMKQYYSERKDTTIQKPDGGFKRVITVDYADMQNRRITEGTAVYYERCSWYMAFEGIENNQLNNRL